MASFDELIKSHPKVLVDFSAEWCAPCKMLKPILKQVKDMLGDEIKIIKIDTDKNPSLATKFQIRGVPTLILFKDGEQVWRQSGVVPAENLVQIIKSY